MNTGAPIMAVSIEMGISAADTLRAKVSITTINTDSPLTLLWLAKEHHPKLFSDIDMNQEIKDFYKNFYKLELTDADIEQIYTPNRAAAGGIKK